MKWEKVEKNVNMEGTTITYEAVDTRRQLFVQSRKRHIPHANGIGTWDHTTYHVIINGKEIKTLQSLRDAKEYAEKAWKTKRPAGAKIRAIAKRPDSGFYVTNVSDKLENLQKFVGGYIEIVQLYGDVAVICNEEGRIHGLPYNCTIDGISFCGDILIVGTDGEEFCDLDQNFVNSFSYFEQNHVEV